jgi:predicted Zn-ribbon and HTH transcriptional regulator
MIRLIFVDDQCEDCGTTFKRAQYDSTIHRCQPCRQIYEIRRIAEALEYWVGNL